MSIDFKTLTPEEMAICHANFLKSKAELEKLILDYRSNIGKESEPATEKVAEQASSLSSFIFSSPIPVTTKMPKQTSSTMTMRDHIVGLFGNFSRYFYIKKKNTKKISKHEVLPLIEWLDPKENANIIAEINKLTDRASENDEFTVKQYTGLADRRYDEEWTDLRLILNETNLDFILEYVAISSGMDIRVYIDNTEHNFKSVRGDASKFIRGIAEDAGLC